MTSPAIKLAIECGAEVTRPLAPHEFSIHAYVFDEQQLERFYAKAQAQALRDAADEVDEIDEDFVASWLRRMADELERGA